jgi:rubredoxin
MFQVAILITVDVPVTPETCIIPVFCGKERESLMKRYMCLLCGYIYDESVGWPEEGIPAGTLWDDVPPNWQCPECGATKFESRLLNYRANVI